MSDLRESLTQSGTLYGFINTIVYAHDYNDLSNKPQINGVTLQGNKTASELGLVTPATEAVQSVNGETGAVVLDGNDIDYDSTKTINQQIDAVAASIPVMAVTSVNGETGDVVLDGSDIRYDADYTVTAKIAAVEGEIPVVPVQSVNGETGTVVLDGDDIAYNSSLSVNQKIDAVEAAIPVVSYPVTSVNSKTGAVVLDDTDIEHSSGVSVNSLINTIMNYTPVYGNTASGAIATFDTSLALPLQDCTIAINAVQESGTPTPQDSKAISGFTGANIYDKGLNLFGGTYGSSYSIFIPAGTQVVASCDYHSGTNTRINYYRKDNTRIDYWGLSQNAFGGTRQYRTFTISEDCYSVKFDTESGDNLQIEFGSIPSNYTAFNSDSTTTAITWQSEAGTVYGGSLDVTSGVLTVTYGMLDLAVSDMNNSEDYPGWKNCGVKNIVGMGVNTLITNGMVSIGDEFNVNTNTNDVVFLNKNTYGLTQSQWINTYPSLTIRFVIPYATPVTYQLTPTQISAIVGTNNVFTDTNGNTSVVYACSLKDYIDGQ